MRSTRRLELREGGSPGPEDLVAVAALEAELAERAAARSRALSRDLPAVLANYRIGRALVEVLTADEARLLVLIAERAGAPARGADLGLDVLALLVAAAGLSAADVARDAGASVWATVAALRDLRRNGLALLSADRWYATDLGARVAEARASRFRVSR